MASWLEQIQRENIRKESTNPIQMYGRRFLREVGDDQIYVNGTRECKEEVELTLIRLYITVCKS